MQPRFDYRAVQPGAMEVMLKLEAFTKSTGLNKQLMELIKIRASQLNGCAYCLDMHTKDARYLGETEQRIYCLSAWRDAPFYTEAERAVLALTEAVTLISEHGVPDDVYEAVRQHFSESEFVELVMVINTINCWNRLAISTKALPGEYEPTAKG